MPSRVFLNNNERTDAIAALKTDSDSSALTFSEFVMAKVSWNYPKRLKTWNDPPIPFWYIRKNTGGFSSGEIVTSKHPFHALLVVT